MKRLFSLVTVSLMALAFLLMLPVRVYAASTADANELFDLNKSGSLTVVYHADQDDVDGTAVKVYYVAEWTEEYDYNLTEGFADCGFDPQKVESNDQWQTIADTLDAYVQANSPSAAAETMISEGKVSFEDLKAGLYFIPALTIAEKNGIRTFSHVLLNLPDYGENDYGEFTWLYEVRTAPKSETYTPTLKDINYFITVVWDDKGYEQYRPDSVIASIYADNVPVQEMKLASDAANQTKTPSLKFAAVQNMVAAISSEFVQRLTEAASEESVVKPEPIAPATDGLVKDVTMSPANNWHYEWTAKDDGTVWNVVGSQVPQYTLTVQAVEKGWILEYHIIVPEKPPVPKTGESFPWIPVVLMSVSGVVLVVFGILSRRKSYE